MISWKSIICWSNADDIMGKRNLLSEADDFMEKHNLLSKADFMRKHIVLV